MLTGDNGILTQAQNSKTVSEKAETIERAKLDIVEIQAENEGKITETQLNEILAKYGTVSGEGENKVITTTDGHTIKVLEIYNGTLNDRQGVSKTIAELYDGYNDPINTENYDENAMHIGDYVNYTAGNWTESKENANPFEFGGYTAGQSRDARVSMTLSLSNKVKYDGWRIWDISDDKQTMTLVTAACPETYYHKAGVGYAYNSEKILTGKTYGSTSLGIPSTPRVWDDYVNKYGSSARVLKKSDLDTWYGKYIDSSITDSLDIREFPLNTENKLISTVQNGYYYYLAEMANANYIYFCSQFVSGDYLSGPLGIRVLVTLTSEVKFDGTPEKLEQDGFTYNRWILK